jgi:hypothetical protein
MAENNKLFCGTMSNLKFSIFIEVGLKVFWIAKEELDILAKSMVKNTIEMK